jgi:hypothetical protein
MFSTAVLSGPLVEPEPNAARQKAGALPKVPSAAKHPACSHDRNLPPHLFRGREIAIFVAGVKRFAAAPALIKSVAK